MVTGCSCLQLPSNASSNTTALTAANGGSPVVNASIIQQSTNSSQSGGTSGLLVYEDCILATPTIPDPLAFDAAVLNGLLTPNSETRLNATFGTLTSSQLLTVNDPDYTSLIEAYLAAAIQSLDVQFMDFDVLCSATLGNSSATTECLSLVGLL